jgi:hypothetical protein
MIIKGELGGWSSTPRKKKRKEKGRNKERKILKRIVKFKKLAKRTLVLYN